MCEARHVALMYRKPLSLSSKSLTLFVLFYPLSLPACALQQVIFGSAFPSVGKVTGGKTWRSSFEDYCHVLAGSLGFLS